MHKYPCDGRGMSSGKSRAITTGATEEHRGDRGFLRYCMPRMVKTLLPDRVGRNLEVHPTVVVGFLGGGKVEVPEQDLVGPVRGEIKECIAYNGVVEDFGAVTVFENEHGRRLRAHGFFCLAESVPIRHRMAVSSAFAEGIRVQRAGTVGVTKVG